MNKFISSVALDFGSKKTGVYYATYPNGINIADLKKEGTLYGSTLTYQEENTALLTTRTANRHARRNNKRNKLAKRLLVLVLEEYFNFPALEHQQAIGFFINRRGFTFIEQNYHKEWLSSLPQDFITGLPKDIKILLEEININSIFENLTEEKLKNLKSLYKVIQTYFELYKTYKKIIKISQDKEEEGQKNNKLYISSDTMKILKIPNKDNKTYIDILPILKKSSSDIQKIIESKLICDTFKKVNDWNFQYINAPSEKTSLDEISSKEHWHNICYAIHKIIHELESGARHRTKYFKEIKKDLQSLECHSHKYLQNFGKAIKNNNNLDIQKMYYLIAHISNLELKPLRKYFNDATPILKKEKHNKNNFISHKKQDVFSQAKLTRILCTWFLKNWRVNIERDGKQKVDDYQNLLKAWKEFTKKDDIIDFFMNCKPILTIPPYQNMNNRHTPKCQTFTLNIEYLNYNYSPWKTWLELLQTVSSKEYYKQLTNININPNIPYCQNIDDLKKNNLLLRQLQFILDRAKKNDPFQLNAMWSISHKIRQLNSQGENHVQWLDKLKKKIDESQLPSILKKTLVDDLVSLKEGTFAHFINKYYQTRIRIKEGRYFLHQEKKNKWIYDNKMFMLCSYKPKQKKHQFLFDISNGFQIQENELILILESYNIDYKDIDNVANWFQEQFKGLQTHSKTAGELQKKYKNFLSKKIEWLEDSYKKNKNQKFNEDDERLRSLLYKIDYRYKEESKKELFLPYKIAKVLWSELEEDKLDNKVKKFANIFNFAQIHNILWKERHGFSSTCPICSKDNNLRMQIDEDNNQAVASRLMAMKVRIIDGVVMKVCESISHHVAKNIWDYIKDKLSSVNEVSIPIICEQNRFEFEPNLYTIKKKTEKSLSENLKNQEKQQYQSFNDKNSRIKEASQNTCPYRGTPLSNDGEIDHIIPRASDYGTLNDEANLIYVSKEANTNRSNKTYYLKNLSTEYKNKIFGTSDDNKIKQEIYLVLVQQEDTQNMNEEEIQFTFGRYLNFTNLAEKQQIAFRHALYLKNNDPLKNKVITTLQNRNRTIVNGTQRYLAQCIADKIYHEVKKVHQEKKIQFDYFEYSPDGDYGIFQLRHFYTKRNNSIIKQNSQTDYSHCIDAQMAFLLALENHKNNGTMGIQFQNGENIYETINYHTGEVNDSNKVFDQTKIEELEDNYKKINLKPKKSNNKIILFERKPRTSPPNFSKMFDRYIFKENAMGERYKPICKFNNKVYVGYPQKKGKNKYDLDTYCTEITKKKNLALLKKIIDNQKYYTLSFEDDLIKIYSIKKVNPNTGSQNYKQINLSYWEYFNELNKSYTEEEKEDIECITTIFQECRYYVKRTYVISAPHVLQKQDNKKYPFYKNWEDFDTAWKKEINKDYATKGNEYDISNVENQWKNFCKQYFKKKNQQVNEHHRVGKFSMLAIDNASGSLIQINRKGKHIFQTIPLENNIIGKDYQNFFYKHSKNFIPISKESKPIKELNKEIPTEFEIDLDEEITPDKFFSKDFYNRANLEKISSDVLEEITVHITNNNITIDKFPLSLFTSYIINYNKDKPLKTLELQTENQLNQNTYNDFNNYAHKKKLDNDIIVLTRDGKISKISIKDNGVEFTLSFKKEQIQKLISIHNEP